MTMTGAALLLRAGRHRRGGGAEYQRRHKGQGPNLCADASHDIDGLGTEHAMAACVQALTEVLGYGARFHRRAEVLPGVRLRFCLFSNSVCGIS
jgi:hypothetical protein